MRTDWATSGARDGSGCTADWWLNDARLGRPPAFSGRRGEMKPAGHVTGSGVPAHRIRTARMQVSGRRNGRRPRLCCTCVPLAALRRLTTPNGASHQAALRHDCRHDLRSGSTAHTRYHFTSIETASLSGMWDADLYEGCSKSDTIRSVCLSDRIPPVVYWKKINDVNNRGYKRQPSNKITKIIDRYETKIHLTCGR